MKLNLMLIATVANLLICTYSSFAADWPNFRGRDKNGISNERGINRNWSNKKFKVLWKLPLGDRGYAGPSVAKGTVYIIDRKGDNDIVKAIDLNSGRIIWDYPYYDGGSGNYGFARSTPTVDNNRIYVMSKSGKLFCLNALNGRKIWSMDIVERFHGRLPSWEMAISPVIDGNKLIVVPGGRTNVVALDKNNGDVIWKGGNGAMPGYATPVIATVNSLRQYLIFTAYNLIGIRPENGSVLWSYPWESTYYINAAAPLVIDNKYILITSRNTGGGMLLKISRDNGRAEEVWDRVNGNVKAHFNSPVYYNNLVFTNSDPDYLVCMDKLSGRVHWKRRGFGKGGLIAVDNIIIAVDGRRGYIYFVEAKPKYKELAKIRVLRGQSWTAPIIAEKKLIVRNKYAIACIDLN
ncbi:MAG: PQQ-binding-like beta-propeller repeat protein [Proteobacteria bacterium]|nr:PQQ-binding-like beta-propeller repeat protein [Pseudomonadota bacterium]